MAERADGREVETLARDAGLKGMAENGFDLALAGETTLEEVAAAIHV